MRKRVLITDISSYKAIVVARYLRKWYPELYIVGVDHRKSTRWVGTKWVDKRVVLHVEPCESSRYVAALRACAEDSAIDILIPVNSNEVRAIMQFRESLAEYVDYMGVNEIYRALDDKHEFQKLLEKQGLPSPKSFISLDDIIFPAVLKPRQGSSARGVQYLYSKRDVDRARRKLGGDQNSYIIQEYIDGMGVGYSGTFLEGTIIVGYAHRRVAEWPISGGSSVVREACSYADQVRLRELVQGVMEVAPWSGWAMFEFKRRENGDFVFIECNPRIWGSIHQGLANGVNYFSTLFGSGKAGDAGQAVRTKLIPLSWISGIAYFLRGDMRRLSDMAAGVGNTMSDVSPLQDPGGFIGSLLKFR